MMTILFSFLLSLTAFLFRHHDAVVDGERIAPALVGSVRVLPITEILFRTWGTTELIDLVERKWMGQ
jgi:hypothetical protein